MRRISQLRHHLRKQLTSTHEANRAALLLLGFGLGIIAAGFFILYLLDPREGDEFSLRQMLSDLYANGGAELLSIAITVLIIERLNRRRAEQERKEELILQMGSPDHGFAIEAVRILEQKGWLQDGSLQGTNLAGANLQGAMLWLANLQEANLGQANLQGAILWEADLEKANLEQANMQEANLGQASMQGVTFKDMFGKYEPPICDENTTLPDGSRWTPGRDWREFTHPKEWAAEQAAKKFSASGSKPNAAQKPETAEAVDDEPL